MTSIEWLIEQLEAPCRGIPSHIIEKAKEMYEKERENSFTLEQMMEFIDLLMKVTLLKDLIILAHFLLAFMIFKYFLQHLTASLKMF